MVASYDPFGQGYMHDWRLEEAVKEGVRRVLRERGRESLETNAELLQAIRALVHEMEMAREDAEVREALRWIARNPRRYYDEDF